MNYSLVENPLPHGLARPYPILAVLLLSVMAMRAQPSGSSEFEYYYESYDSSTESHTIFTQASNVRRRVETRTEVSRAFSFAKGYDSLFKDSPDEFEWDVTLPDGAVFDASRRFLYWKIRSDQLDDYLIKIRVRYRGVRDSAIVAIRVEEKWQSSMIPGANYGFYAPFDPGPYGSFNGLSVEYSLISWVARNNNRGPSHGRIYVRFDLMQSTAPDVKASFFYTAGLNLSLERNPRRLFGIPYFGFELGGMYNAKWNNIFQFTPVAGVWLYADQTNTIALSGGYLIPGEQFETLRGWRASIGGTFSLW